MKQWLRSLTMSTVVMAVVIGCSSPRPEPIAPRSTDGLNLLVAVEGEVQLKRDGWSGYVPVGFGTIIQYDDLLQVDGTATVVCGDFSRYLVGNHLVSAGTCRPPQKICVQIVVSLRTGAELALEARRRQIGFVRIHVVEECKERPVGRSIVEPSKKLVCDLRGLLVSEHVEV